MHISHEEMSSEWRKPERDKEKKLTLNIPIGGTKELSIEENKGSKADLLASKADFLGSKADLLRSQYDLEYSLQKLTLSEKVNLSTSDDSDSDNEEERKKLESTLIPKCPDKLRDLKKEQQRSQSQPYQVPRLVSPGLQAGGGLVSAQKICLQQEPSFFSQIPKPVEEFVPAAEKDELSTWIEELSSELSVEQKQNLDDLVDSFLRDLHEEEGCALPPAGRAPCQPRTWSEESCNSPDSSYETMSPASVPPSPAFSIHSPNPRFEKRNSDSDSAGESELIPIELPYQNIPTVNVIFLPSRQAVQSRQFPTPSISVPISSRPLRPDSVIQVNEVGLERPALDRLYDDRLLNKNVIGVEWNKELYEAKLLLPNSKQTAGLHSTQKPNLKKRLTELIQQGPKGTRYFYEKLHCKIKLITKYFSHILIGNELNEETPLYIAAVQCNVPLVARLIADNIDKQETFDARGNGILHYLAKQGDSHAQVLSELLHSKAFNVNHKNIQSETALHIAVDCHANTPSLASVKQLVNHGAILKIQDINGKTALHRAVSQPNSDPQLLRALLMSPSANEAINVLDINSNTPLHIAASRNDLPLNRHKEFVSWLLNSNARHDLRNRDVRLALSLVNEPRKQELKCFFQRKN